MLPRAAHIGKGYAIAVAIAVVALGGGTARAATVSVVTDYESPHDGGTRAALDYEAAAGETNTLTATRDGAGVRLTDTTAPLTTGAGCTSVDAHTATCRQPAGIPLSGAGARLGDGDDTAVVDGASWTVDGGAGDDHLTNLSGGSSDGGPGRDVLRTGPAGGGLAGGPGADVLLGGPGNDGLDGEDQLAEPESGGYAGDTIDGGGGNDTVSYAGRLSAVVVDLAQGVGGGPGEHDRIANVENIDGPWSGRSVLAGDNGPNALEGGGVLLGRGGDDTLIGGNAPGGDVLRGGDGNDGLSDFVGRADMSCGRGTSDLALAGHEGPLAPLIPVDCNRIRAGDEFDLVGLRASSTRVRGYAIATAPLVSGGLALYGPHGVSYGRGHFVWNDEPADPGQRRGFLIHLTRAGRHAAAAHQRALVRALVSYADDSRGIHLGRSVFRIGL